MQIQAEISLYPLGELDALPEILAFIDRLEAAGLEVQPGPLSTLASGECRAVFAALGEAFAAAGGKGRRVLTVKALSGPAEAGE